MEHYVYYPQGVCSRQIDFDIDDNGLIHNLTFLGGCNGNLKAISKLCEGKDAESIASILTGNTCGPRPTSCADQLSKALLEAINQKR